uniref:Ig-like domain-containing protein n=1 Tax=Periophthalmus magnuspinnatus TaxID=409849 RepID=A0A3B4B1V5_9GOBI
MKTFVALILLGILIKDMIHTLRIFAMTSSQVPNFPEYVAVTVVNGLEVIHCDSDTRRTEPKQEWMNRVTEDDPKFWIWTTQLCVNNLQRRKHMIENLKQRLNQTEGSIMLIVCSLSSLIQNLPEELLDTNHACLSNLVISPGQSWTRVFPVGQGTFCAGHCQSCATPHSPDVTLQWPALIQLFLVCLSLLWCCVELPLVSLLQKSSSSPVTCHATGFYPDRARLFWTKDGDELLEDVDPGEILPNEDGTFQTSVSLDLSSVPPEDWDRYHCVFQLSGDKNKYVTRLDRSKIRTNGERRSPSFSLLLLQTPPPSPLTPDPSTPPTDSKKAGYSA